MSVVFVEGWAPNQDMLLLDGSMCGRDDAKGQWELDGFVTKLLPPATAPVANRTTRSMVARTRRIKLTTSWDKTVTALCLLPLDLRTGIVGHSYVVGSTTALAWRPQQAYIVKMCLDNLSKIWKVHVPSIYPEGICGNVLDKGCVVAPDGQALQQGR